MAKRKQTPLEKFTGSLQPGAYVPSTSFQEDMGRVEQANNFLRYFKTPQDIEQYKNFILNTEFENIGVKSPYETIANGKAVLRPDIDINDMLWSDNDTPEQKVFKQIGMQLAVHKGKVPTPTFLEEAVNNSFTAGWAKMLGDNMFDFRGSIKDLTMLEDGIYYKDKKLNLNPEQTKIINEYTNHITGASKDDSAFDDAVKLAVGLTFDAPLFYLTGGISGGTMKLGTVTANLAKSTGILPRILGQTLQQSINFNILGVPQTIQSTKESGVDGMLGSIWNNTVMGTLAAVTAGSGLAVGKATGKLFMKNSPAIREEMGALLGSIGFGYTSGKIGGASDEDALATGLAFAATHFTNPVAYKRVLNEIKNKNVRLFTESYKPNLPSWEQVPDYFLEKDGKYHKIESSAFRKYGDIVTLDSEPIEVTSSNKKQFVPINSIPDLTQVQFRKALIEDRMNKNADKMYQRWIDDLGLDSDYIKEHKAELRSLAEMISATAVGAKLAKTFGKWKLPEDKELNNRLVVMPNKWQLPYSDVKNYVLKNLSGYLSNPDKFVEKLAIDNKIPNAIKPDLEKVMEATVNAVVKQSYRTTTDLTSFEKIMADVEAEKDVPSDILVDAEGKPIERPSGKTLLTAEEIKAGKKSTKYVKAGKQYDKYDINGQTVDIEKLDEERAKVRGTYYEFKVDPEKVVKTTEQGEELKVGDKVRYISANQEHSGIVTLLPLGNDKVTVQDTKTKETFTIPLNKINQGAEYGKKSVGKPENKQTDVGGLRTEAGSSNRPINVEGKETPRENEGEGKRGETVSIEPKVEKDVSKSQESKLIEPTSKVEKVEPEVEKEKIVEPTKPIEEFTQAELDSLKNPIVETIKKQKDKGFTVNDEGIKESLDQIYEKAQQLADQKNAELMQNPNNRNKDGTLNKSKQWDAEHFVVKMLAAGQPQLSSQQVAAILAQRNPAYRNEVGEDIDNMFKKTGKLKDVNRLAKGIAVFPERPLERPATESDEIAANMMKEVQEKTQMAGKEFQPEAEMMKTGEEVVNAEIEKAAITKEEKLGQALEDFIIATAPDRNSGKTIEQVIKEQLEFGNITKEEADYIEKMFGGKKGVGKKFNIADDMGFRMPSDREIAIGNAAVEFNRRFSKEYPIRMAVKKVPQVFTPTEIEAAGLRGSSKKPVGMGMTWIYFTDGRVEIDIDPRYGDMRTVNHEVFHGLTELILDKAVLNKLLIQNGWDGVSPKFDKNDNPDISYARAEERLADKYMNWIDGTSPQLRGFAKLREFFKQTAKFLFDRGFRQEARFFKNLTDGKIELRRKISPVVEKTYDPKLDKMPIEDANRLYQIGTEEERSPRDEIKDSDVLRDWNKREPNKWKEDKFFEKFTKSQLADVPSYAKNGIEWLWKNMRPPDFTAKMMPRFAKTYDIGNEHIVLKAPQAFNQTMRENWYIKKDGKSFFNTLPEDVKNDYYGNKVNEYYFKDLASNKHGRMLTKEEFQKEYKLTSDQIKIDNAFQATIEDAKKKARQGQKEIYLNETENLSAELTAKKFKEFFPEILETEEKPLDKAREILKTDEVRKEAIADYLVEKLYDYSVRDEDGKVIGQAHYMPFTRSSDPNNWLIDMKNAKGERRSMEAKTKQEAEAKLAEWQSKGYEVTVDMLNKETNEVKKVLARDVIDLESQGWENIGSNYYRIKDIIGTGQFYNRMTERQLKNMAALGHIPFNDPVIQKLKDSMKAGKFAQHQLEREFVPGVDMTPQRMEESLEEFVKQATGINRLIGNIKLTKELEQWSRESDLLHKSTKTPVPTELRDKYNIKGTMVTDSELSRIKTELGYGIGYINNITHSDASMIDVYRKLVTAWMLGVRPSYIFQQPFQIFQKLLPYAMTENKDGSKLFWNALGESVKLKGYIRANDKGMSQKDIDAFGFDKDMYNTYLALKDMNKMGKVGIEELTSQMGDINYRYAKGLSKTFETAIKLASMPAGAAEKFTRIVAMNTFYKIGKANGLSGDKLNKYIANNIDLTMDLWGAPGRAPLFASKEYGKKQNPFMKGLDKSFMTFKTYATHNLAQYEYLMRNRQWTALGVKTAVGLGLHGATKFPLVAGMFAIANLFNDDETEYDFMAELDKLDGIVPGLGSTLSRGVFANAGFDASGLFDERSIFPTDLVSNLRSYSAEGMVAEAFMGAPYGFAQDVVTGSKSLYDVFSNEVLNEPMTDVEKQQVKKGLAKFLPLALRNIATVAVNWDKDGVTVRNNVIIKREDLTWKDVFYKLMSFNPIDVAKKTEELIFGFPAKFKRAEGKITEVRKVYKEIASSKKYTPEERTEEMKKIAQMYRDAQAGVIAMKRTQEYRDAIKAGLIK